MPAVLFLFFVVVPFAEIAVLIAVGRQIGILPTILLLIGFSAAGALLAKREGVATWRRFRESVSRGEVPAGEIVDGFLILFGAALLLTPGFLTDALGLIVLFPPSRQMVKAGLRRAGGFVFLKRFRFFRI